MFTSLPSFDEVFTNVINAAAVAANKKQEKRNYLGVSRWGEECARRLYYEFNHYPIDKEELFDGETLRIFDMGHDGESRMIDYMRAAGFHVSTEKEDGNQHGFTMCYGKLSGHADGIVYGGPIQLPYPLIWENKALGAKSFKDVKSKGLKDSKSIYYVQMNAYMAYIGQKEDGTPGCENGLFTALNRDNGEIYSEIVSYDVRCAQEASDKAVKVIEARAPEDLARCSNDPNFFMCKWCPFAKTCWAQKEQVSGYFINPNWL